MFKKIYRQIDAVMQLLQALKFRAVDIAHDTMEINQKVSSMETWVELLADTKADAVAEEFERLLKEHHSSGQKTTNTALKELVHQAVLNSK